MSIPAHLLLSLSHEGGGSQEAPELLLLHLSPELLRRLECARLCASSFGHEEVVLDLTQADAAQLLESARLLDGVPRSGHRVSIEGTDGRRIDGVLCLDDFTGEVAPDIPTSSWTWADEEGEDCSSEQRFQMHSAWLRCRGHAFEIDFRELNNDDVLQTSQLSYGTVPGLLEGMAQVRSSVIEEMTNDLAREQPDANAEQESTVARADRPRG